MMVPKFEMPPNCTISQALTNQIMGVLTVWDVSNNPEKEEQISLWFN